MRNFQARSATQPDLDDVGNLVRFKGCYLLNSIQQHQTSQNYTQKVAIVSDVEGTGELELRLLGDHFTDLEKYIGEYISLEAAIKHHNRGYFFYLAWYDLIAGDAAKQAIDQLQHTIEKEEQHALQRVLLKRTTEIKDNSIKSLCLSLLEDACMSLTYRKAKEALLSDVTTNDNQFCVELVSMVSRRKEISFVGELLNSIESKAPIKLWEQTLLGD
ncbi:hypothetical protein J9B83_14505 [Marinomonas sp. A79]|uniref:Uncharacterized protein n=1 Tax=Marinomonas vulgaris TaxID=2823372 RepID=A0ABS5HFD9_9GAMM|nr:hypothetical protein [Marinomonas vulgaris]MBR7890122.1 hypothetical protein [Marinomonas vulgaris]